MEILPFKNLVIGSMYAPDFPPGHVSMQPSAPFLAVVGTDTPIPELHYRVKQVLTKLPNIDFVVVDGRVPNCDELRSRLMSHGWNLVPTMETALRYVQGHHIWASDGTKSSVVMDVTNEDPSEDGWLWHILMSRFGGSHVAGDTLITGNAPLWLRSLVHAEESAGHQVLFGDMLEALAVTYRLAA